ncbi:MAG: acyl-CoA dehydrogenase family protein [Acidobacteriota bacterium]|nr:acyl-CoA dehydrogenase family protein [Acidobacteriota bacterium]MDE2922119.1 acyl-CoA dehydrogenase family protein [Acidobacteriota bacterium]MDE3265831.1 acyl-CoA dehydrogenase family protein [Acidobacteriota bacterium]
MSQQQVQVSEEKARAVAEESRQKEWKNPSFMKELFLGNFRFDLISPYPSRDEWRPEFESFYSALTDFLRDEVDPVEIDVSEDYPDHVIDGLARLGAFGMKIPTEYGGLGFDQVEYAQVMELIGSFDGNLTALLSAHQSIGVPQPVNLFGTEELKRKYLPRCAAGEISAFALTEPEVGSDPARLSTSCVLDGDFYVLNGTKLWCTNGTKAKLLVVMAMDPETEKISSFVVETDWEGVEVERRCHFMGLNALANGIITFDNVKVPKENLIGKEGRGLKIALTTLNDGRLSIPNSSVGAAKYCLKAVREFGSSRIQWGVPIGKHEAIAQKISDIAAYGFAMEAIVKLASHMSNDKRLDLRLESAACKEWNTWRGWQIIDETMQVRGGRGYETESSLRDRGEDPVGIERMMRDFRINRIFEGSSEIMHLIMAREAVDKHLQVAGTLIDRRAGTGAKLLALPKIGLFYAWWYPTRWLAWSRWPRYAGYGKYGKHLRFIDRAARKLARESFHGMLVYREKMERRQMFLFRLVDVVNELFAMAASVSRAHSEEQAGTADAAHSAALCDLFCRMSRRRVKQLFRELWHNEDDLKYRTAQDVMGGRHIGREKLLDDLDPSGRAPRRAAAAAS